MILDAGSGARPLPEANVLCDLYFPVEQREEIIVIPRDKPFLICDIQYMPFRDKIFEYVHCSHVLEHVWNPVETMEEFRRIANHGYVETPSWLAENILFGWPFHRWTIFKNRGGLYASRPIFLRIFGFKVLPFGWFLHRVVRSSRVQGNVVLGRSLPFFRTRYWF